MPPHLSIALVLCLLASTVLFTAIAFAVDKLRVSYASVTGNTAGITYIAQRAGLFEKQGLDVEIILITGGPASISALLNGDVDLDMRAPIAALQAMAHGVKLTFLVSQSNTLEYDVVTRPEIKDIKQLKGKKVGIIRFGGISELMVRYLFQKIGLDADKDIAIIQVGQARFVALEKGAIERDRACVGGVGVRQAQRLSRARYADSAVFWKHDRYDSRACCKEVRRYDSLYARLSRRGEVFFE